jgi:hypothetical protein
MNVKWNIGMLECWAVPTVPIFHHSNYKDNVR